MKKLILLILLVVSSFIASSQHSNEATTIPNTSLEKVLKAAKLSRVLQQEVNIQDRIIKEQDKRINVKDSALYYAGQQIDNQIKINAALKSNISVLYTKQGLLEQEYSDYKVRAEDQIKQLNKKRIINTFKGTAIGAGVGILICLLLIK